MFGLEVRWWCFRRAVLRLCSAKTTGQRQERACTAVDGDAAPLGDWRSPFCGRCSLGAVVVLSEDGPRELQTWAVYLGQWQAYANDAVMPVQRHAEAGSHRWCNTRATPRRGFRLPARS